MHASCVNRALSNPSEYAPSDGDLDSIAQIVSLYQKSKIDFPKASIFFRSPLGKSENERSLMYDSGTCVFGEAAGAAVAGAASCPSPPSARTTTFGPVFDDNALLDDDDDDDDGFFKNHSSLFCKALTFSLLERRTDNGLTSYSLSLFLSRTNEQKQPNDVHSLFNAINILNILI